MSSRAALGTRLLLAALLLTAGCADGRSAPDGGTALGAATAALDVGGRPVQAWIADTQAARARGLGGVSALGPDQAMLFVYPDLERRRFWMKDCVIPLDIAFLDAAGRVVQVETLAPPQGANAPLAQTTLSPPSAYALEVQAGFFRRHGLGIGTRVAIPTDVRREQAE